MSQINESSNSVSKLTLSTGGTPTSSSPSVSTNPVTRETLTTGQNAWEGDDLTDNAPPGDFFGVPGLNELGGVAHFKARTLPVITH